ncbi:MAG: phenylalanine--tRNA ligase subunit beta, partial [Planctomycetes bacterium]|nr:phenylalanine--tRNA ligase subunit beta [Planctomycetota bacterium]
MKISLNWLTDYVDVSMPAPELAELLTAIGWNCEEIIETPNDIIFDLEITSNRSDCLGHLGVAREVGAALGRQFTPPNIPALPTEGKVEDLAEVIV